MGAAAAAGGARFFANVRGLLSLRCYGSWAAVGPAFYLRGVASE